MLMFNTRHQSSIRPTPHPSHCCMSCRLSWAQAFQANGRLAATDYAEERVERVGQKRGQYVWRLTFSAYIFKMPEPISMITDRVSTGGNAIANWFRCFKDRQSNVVAPFFCPPCDSICLEHFTFFSVSNLKNFLFQQPVLHHLSPNVLFKKNWKKIKRTTQ